MMKILSIKKEKDYTAAVELSKRIGYRFVLRKDRHMLQVELVEIGGAEQGDTTWVDVPLCPETYGPAVKI